MDFKDLFDGYQLTKYPSTASSSPLSSAPSSPLQWKELKPDVDEILTAYEPKRQEDDTVHVFRTFLEYLCKDAQTTLMQEIKQFGENPDDLRQLRNFLIDSILKPMMMAGGKQPKSLTPTPIQEARYGIKLAMTKIEPSSRRDQSTLKKECLRRDNHRCLFTDMVDRDHFKSLPPQSRGNLRICSTKCAHIIPFALGKFDPKSSEEVEVKAQIWWALYRYFPFITEKIGPENINTPSNAVTLRLEAHAEFGALRLAAEPVDEDHKYRMHTLRDASYAVCQNLPSFVTWTQSDPAVKMPDPDFLRLHYQVSKILEVSGFGMKFEKIMWENENSARDIQPDGSTDLGHILSQKMLMDM